MDDADFYVVKQYLRRAATRVTFWKGVEVTTKLNAVGALNQLPDEKVAWQHWIAHWLTEAQCKKLQVTIRKQRQRQKGKDITISEEAHRILLALSDGGKLSLSQVIETRLKRAYTIQLKKLTIG